MSYSRWIQSRWYTYWQVHPRDSVETRNNAIFTICGCMSFPASEIRDHMNLCLGRVKAKDEEASDLEIAELRVYMAEFLEDIEKEYPRKGGDSPSDYN